MTRDAGVSRHRPRGSTLRRLGAAWLSASVAWGYAALASAGPAHAASTLRQLAEARGQNYKAKPSFNAVVTALS